MSHAHSQREGRGGKNRATDAQRGGQRSSFNVDALLDTPVSTPLFSAVDARQHHYPGGVDTPSASTPLSVRQHHFQEVLTHSSPCSILSTFLLSNNVWHSGRFEWLFLLDIVPQLVIVTSRSCKTMLITSKAYVLV